MNEDIEPTIGDQKLDSDTMRVVGSITWTSLIFFCIMGLLTQLHGLRVGFRDGIGTISLWGRDFYFSIFNISFDTYFIYAPLFFILFSIYLGLRSRTDRDGVITIIASITSLVTACLWTIFRFISATTSDIFQFALSFMIWGGAIIMFGVTFILVALVFLKQNSLLLTRLTGFSFLIVGVVALVVGFIGGFTLLPWFTFYDFPWVTTIAILPCVLAVYHEVIGPKEIPKTHTTDLI